MLTASIGVASMLHYHQNVRGLGAKLTMRPTQANAKLGASCCQYKQLTLLSRE